jgi:hypothetical protein
MSRKAAEAAKLAERIVAEIMANKKVDRKKELMALAKSWVLSPVGAAGGVAAAGVAIATLPFMKHTRSGVLEGLDSDAADVLPGSDAMRETLLRTSGFVLGGTLGAHVSWEMIHAATVNGAMNGYLRTPVAAFGGIASAFIGMEMAEPAATFGTRVGRTMSLGAEGLRLDLYAVLGYDDASPSWSADGGRGGGGGAGAANGGGGVEEVRGGGGRRWGWWGRGGGGGGGGAGGSGGSGSSSSSSSPERDAAGKVDVTSQDALTRELVRLRRAEATTKLERSRIASSQR